MPEFCSLLTASFTEKPLVLASGNLCLDIYVAVLLVTMSDVFPLGLEKKLVLKCVSLYLKTRKIPSDL